MAFDREKTLQSAQRLVGRRKYGRAIAEYQRVMEQDPNDARTLLRIGDLQARLGSHAEAVATYDRVALFYSGRGFSLKAIAVLKQIRELIDRHVPHLAEQYSHVSPKLAQLYAELGLVSDALATYDAVARSLQSRGRDRDAVEIIRRMIDLEEANPLPHLRLAEALCRIQRVGQAIEHFWSAAHLLRGQDRNEDALKVVERILHFQQDPAASRVAAEIYLARGSRESGLQALSRLQSCFEADPRDMETLGLLARAFDQIEQPDKSVEVYKEMVRVGLESGSGPALEEHLEHLLRVAGTDPEVQQLVAQAGFESQISQLEGRGWAEAAEATAVERAAAPSDPPSSIADDDIEFLEEDSFADLPLSELEASSELPGGVPEEAVPGSPGEPPAHPSEDGTAGTSVEAALQDAKVFRGLKLYSKASAVLRGALDLAPDSVPLREALRNVLLDAGDTEAAAAEMLELARLHVDRRCFAEAREELVEHQRLLPRSLEASRALRHIGLLEARERAGAHRRSQNPDGAAAGVQAEGPLSLASVPFVSIVPASSVAPAADEPSPTVAVPLARPLPAFRLEEEASAALGAAEPSARQTSGVPAGEAPASILSVSPESEGAVVYVQSEPPGFDSAVSPPAVGASESPSLSPVSLPPISLSPILGASSGPEAPSPQSAPAPSLFDAPAAGRSDSVTTPRATTPSADAGLRPHSNAQPAAFRSNLTRGAIPVPRAFAAHARQSGALHPSPPPPRPSAAPVEARGPSLEPRASAGWSSVAQPESLGLRSKPTLPSVPAARPDASAGRPSGNTVGADSEPPLPMGVSPPAELQQAQKAGGSPPAAAMTSTATTPQKLAEPDSPVAPGPRKGVPSSRTQPRPETSGPIAGERDSAPKTTGLARADSAPPSSFGDPVAAVLEEAEFFAARGLQDDALAILRDELQRRGDEPRLRAAVAALEEAPREAASSRPQSAVTPELPGVKFSTEGMLDQHPTSIDSALDLEAAVNEPSEAEVDVDAVFSKFKEGVKAQIPESDSSTHYDLAVAYQEMGLVEDAIAQFRVAARDPKRACGCLGMIALLHRQAGRLDDAAEALVRGLSLSQKTVSQEFGLYYALGEVYEQKGDPDEAIYYFGRIRRRDPNYRGVSERIEKLRPLARRRSDPVRFVGSLDEAFDQLQKDS